LNLKHHYLAIYKPYGYLSQFVNNQNTRRNKALLGQLATFPEGIMAVGRLDEKSEGILLLTTDGKFSEFIRGKQIEKEYWVQVDGEITEKAMAELRTGVLIKVNKTRYKTKPAIVSKLSVPLPYQLQHRKERDSRHGCMSWLSITITEGKFRQVRKMTAAVGFPTLRLVRVRIGNYHLNGMNIDAVNKITPESFQYTYKTV